MSLNVTTSSPIKDQLRAMCLDIKIVIEQIGNGEQANANAALATIQSNLSGIKSQVNSATSASITTL